MRKIVENSKSMKEVIAKLGYKTKNGSNAMTVKKRLEKYDIPIDHFESVKTTKRTTENVFCINSTATQAVLRRWYRKVSDYTSCAICGQDSEWNSKPLTMILDHINGDNHDNRLENLRWICPNCNSQLDTFAGRNNKTQIVKDEEGSSKAYVPINIQKTSKKICPVCNIEEISKYASMCVECRTKERRKNIPSKEDLEKIIGNESFVSIGKMYGVSDNAVRKWCKIYGLPYRYGELHKYAS